MGGGKKRNGVAFGRDPSQMMYKEIVSLAKYGIKQTSQIKKK